MNKFTVHQAGANDAHRLFLNALYCLALSMYSHLGALHVHVSAGIIGLLVADVKVIILQSVSCL